MTLYKELEAETGQSCGVFQPGSLYLAQTEDREHQLRLQEAKARRYGMNFHEVSRDEAERLHPLVNFDGIRCIMFEPDGGNVDPSGVTNAYAVGARQRGAEIHRFTPVIGTEAQPDGTWIVRTEKGDIRTPWVVNAAGLWAREVAAMAGLDLPLIPTEHQYFVTEAIPEIAAMDRRLPSVADRDGEYYLRQEGQGLLVGAYERDMRFWAEDGYATGLRPRAVPDDLERIEENMMRAIDRVPVVGEAGIKRVINGPMIWSPDSSALFGPVPELTGLFLLLRDHPRLLAERGARQARRRMDGRGRALARHVRLGPGAVRGLGRQGLHQGARGRPVRAPLQDPFPRRGTRGRAACAHASRLRDAEGDGREVRLNYGWEHPLFFDETVEDSAGFTRQPLVGRVGREARMLRGPRGHHRHLELRQVPRRRAGREDWLNALFANRMPRRSGAPA
jgi:dimethylglycine dehydrogenase